MLRSKGSIMNNGVLDLGGTTAVITGAACGVGKNCTFFLSQLGASVVVADIASDAGRRTAEEIPRRQGEIRSD
jgi:NAD(P)-dependent dehydrogenase (short-subunit alcohol dehydrogenase family)